VSDLRELVQDRLSAEGLLPQKWSALVLAALDGRDALENLLVNGEAAPAASVRARRKPHAGAYLTSVSVQGFRGIGPKQTLRLTPGPSLTLVVGRNGSGKSSFAEALEVLFTGDSRRWSDRSKIWKEGWRNLHRPHPASIEAGVLLEGYGEVTVACAWEKDAPFEAQNGHVQPKGKPKTTLEKIGWTKDLVSYRPFLSYNELGSMLDEGPSKLYDALSLVLGLEELVNAQTALSKSRLDRQNAFEAADAARAEHVNALTAMLQTGPDDRASACLAALTAKPWRLGDLDRIVSARASPSVQDVTLLAGAAMLDGPDPGRVGLIVTELRNADQTQKAVAGTDAETSRELAALLEGALAFHASHGDGDCPVCGNAAALGTTWREAALREVERLRRAAAVSEDAHRAGGAARRQAHDLLTAPPKLLSQLAEIGIDGASAVETRWRAWHDGAGHEDLLSLADHLASRHEDLALAIAELKELAASELRRREDRWRPIAAALSAWSPPAAKALAAREHIALVKEAEDWLKDASAGIRSERFNPIAEQATATWRHLRQQSNVELGKIELAGTKSQRRVTLDVTVDGIPGAALGVMSQGELNSLALSLFLPRATLSESPFRFVVIDDPVQSMDPARVDGLARALAETARTRQVIVFTHDDRLSEAVRRLNIESTILGVTRRPKSVVEVRVALDPVRAHIEDALALVATTDLPLDVLRRLVPGFCRLALESCCQTAIRRRWLGAGRAHAAVEEELRDAGKLTPLAALALFDDRNRGGDVMKRLNQFGAWAGTVFKQCKDGAHEAVAADLKIMIDDTERLAGRIAELK
jgi:energy-coupling factor transporter ATP-binding protein EcfA2